MIDRSFQTYGELSAPDQERVDSICTAFEDAYRSQTSPDLAEFLGRSTFPGLQAVLLRELLKIDVAWRAQRGERIDREEYAHRFPQFTEIIAGVFEELANRRASAEDSVRTDQSTVNWTRSNGAGHAADFDAEFPHLPNYEILKVIAQGGMGVVYQARQRGINRLVALKMTLAGRFASAEERRRFHGEAEAAGRLNHPHIVPIYEVGELEGQPYFSMAYVEGPSLKTLLAEGPLPARQAAEWLRTMADAVGYAHQRDIIHRDLKPANVLIDAAGRPQITDFGLAKKIAADSGLTATGQVLGTPSFMPPEQARGDAVDVGPSADVYSLGATLYNSITGRPPFQAATVMETLQQVLAQDPVAPTKLNPAVPRDLETVCLKCLQKEPGKRYASARELSEELDRFLKGVPILARPVSRMERGWQWCRRNPVVALLSLTIAISLAAGSIVSTIFGMQANARANAINNKNAELEIEKQRVKEKNDALATETQRVTEKNAELRSLLAAGFFSRGVSESDAGQYDVGLLNLQRACRVLDPEDPLVPHYRAVFQDRSLNSGRWWTPRMRHLALHVQCAFDPAGERILMIWSDGAAWLWDAETGKPVGGPFRSDESAVKAVAFGPDGDRFVVLGDNGRARIWDAATGVPVGEPLRHEPYLNPDGTPQPYFVVTSVAFSAKGDRILTVGRNYAKGTAQIWETRTGHPVGRPFRFEASLLLARLSPDGDKLLAVLPGGNVVLQAVETGEVIGEPLKHDKASQLGPGFVNPLNSLAAFSPQGDRFLTAWGNTVGLWDGSSGLKISDIVHEDTISSAVFSPQGDRILTASQDKTVRVWDAQTGEDLGQTLHFPKVAFAAEFSPDGRRIATASERTVELWDAQTFVPLGKPLLHDNDVSLIQFSPRGDRILTGSRSTKLGTNVQLWKLSQTAPVGRIPEQVDPVSAQFSPKSDRILTVAPRLKMEVRLWEAETGNQLGTLKENIRYVRAGFTPQGDRIVTGSADGSAQVWDGQTAEPIGNPMVHPESRGKSGEVGRFSKAQPPDSLTSLQEHSPIAAMALSPDGERALIGYDDGYAQLWDLRDQSEVGTPVKHDDSITAVAFHPQGDWIVTAGLDATVKLSNGRTGELLSSHTSPEFTHIHTISFNAAGDRLLLSFIRSGLLVPPSMDRSYLWKFQDGKLADSPPLSFLGEAARPSFNLKGDRIATILGQAVRVWDAETGQQVGEVMRHVDEVYCAAFSPLGHLIVTGGKYDGQVQVWDARTGIALGQPFEPASPAGLPDLRRRGGLSAGFSGGPAQGQVESVTFSATGDRILAAHAKQVLQWEVPVPPRPADFESYCELITGHRLTGDGEATELAREEWIELWNPEDREQKANLARDVALKVCGLNNGNSNLQIQSTGESKLVAKIEDLPTGVFQIDVINLAGEEVDDAFIKDLQLHRLPPLDVLIIRNTRITSESLKELGRLSRLPDLNLADNPNIRDDGLEHLAKLGIQTLRVNNIQMTDKGLAALKQLKDLRLLEVAGNKCSGAGIADLRTALPECQIFP